LIFAWKFQKKEGHQCDLWISRDSNHRWSLHGKYHRGGSTIRWRKGKVIGHGDFGHLYMAMNFDSGEVFLFTKYVFFSYG